MEDLEQILQEYVIQAYQVGIDYHDYLELKKIIKRIDTYVASLKNKIHRKTTMSFDAKSFLQGEILFLVDLQIRFWNLSSAFEEVALRRNYNQFIEHQASIVHLIYTNNQYPNIPRVSYDKFHFLCQFHQEKTPSLEVSNQNHSFFCYGCGVSGGVLEYMMQYEQLSKQNAIRLLRSIYLLDSKEKKIDTFNPLWEKYRSTLVSPEFFAFLKSSEERMLQLPDSYRKRAASKTYQEIFETMKRVENKEPLFYQDTFPKQKIYKLELPDFDVSKST